MDLHGGHHWIMGEHFRLFTTLITISEIKVSKGVIIKILIKI